MKTIRIIFITMLFASVCVSTSTAQSKAQQAQKVVKALIPKRAPKLDTYKQVKKQVQKQVQEVRTCGACSGSGIRTYVNQYGYYYNDYCNVCRGRGLVTIWVTKWVWE